MNKWTSPLTGQLVEYEEAQAHRAMLAEEGALVEDNVRHPNHYIGKDGLEVIQVIRSFGLDKSFELGNAVKYLLRHENKENSLQDIKKARQMLDMYIEEHDTEKE